MWHFKTRIKSENHPIVLYLQDGEIRLKNTEIVLPVVVGTAAFHLGKKASHFAREPYSGIISVPEHDLVSLKDDIRLEKDKFLLEKAMHGQKSPSWFK